ncbi:MAG TPA: rod shape-determining protein MreC [Candidatus Paceibacterota bacterium]|nr:rod shape-determining protein MreC [Candidatus Paceibacterota bacterium]
MMNSYRQNDQRARRRLLIATAIVVLLVVFDLVSGGMVRHVVRRAVEPIWGGVSSALGHIGTDLFSTRASLAAQNAALKAQVTALQQDGVQVSALEAENAQLRSLVHLAAAAQGIAAPVVSSFTSSPYGTFTIGVGSSGGVTKGALVLTADGFVIGRVSDVSTHDALVTETFAPGQSIDVIVDGVPVSLKGAGGGEAEGQIPASVTVATSGVAVAPSLGQRPVGIVGSAMQNSDNAYQRVLVRIPSNLNSLSYVYVETTR